MAGDKEYIVNKVRHLKGRTFKALLGKGDSGETVLVTGKANYVWIRVKYGSSLGAPVHALNRHVPPIHGRMVRVQEIDRAGIKGFEVIGFDDKGTPYYHDTTNAVTLPAHGHTHESSQDSYGTDPVNLYTRGWAELRVEPTDPCSLYTYVTHGWYMCEDLGWFAGGNSPLFVPPDAGLRYDLVYIDCSGTIGIETGDVGGEVALIPEPPDFTIPLAAIQLTGSVGCIVEDMILDCRVMPNLKMPAGGSRFDDSISPSTIFPDAAAWAGAQDYPSRTDHRHGINCAVANTIVPDATAAEGTSTSFSRADHAHGIVCDTPGMIHAVDTISLEGTGTSFARADHIHGLNVASPVSVGLANAEGGSTEFVRKDHAHQGVHSLSEAGQAQLFGDVTLSEGANVTLTQAGQDIQIASAGGGGAAAVHQHDGPAAAQGGDTLNPTTLYVTGTATFANGVYALDDVDIADDLTVHDHAWMQTGTCAGDFQVGGVATVNTQLITPVGVPVSVGAANTAGAATDHVRRDHAHEGVHSVSKSGDVQIYGDVTLSEGANITLTEVGQNIQITAGGGGGGMAVHQHSSPAAADGGNILNPTTVYVTGTTTCADDLRISDGVTGDPALQFINSPTTGLYRIGADHFGWATAGVKAMEIDSSQRVGIGGAPSYRLDIQETKTDVAGGFQYMGRGELTCAPAGASATSFVSQYNRAVSGGTQNLAALYGFRNWAEHSSDGTLQYLYGSQNTASNFGGDVTNAFGGFYKVEVNEDEIITTAYGLYTSVNAGAGTDAYGLYVETVNTGDTAYGIYVADNINATTTYGIYQAGADDTNYFAGPTHFDDVIYTDTIDEQTGGVGVTIDGCLIKDGYAQYWNPNHTYGRNLVKNSPGQIVTDGAEPQWWDDVANATLTDEDTVGEGIADKHERVFKCVSIANDVYGYQTLTFADEELLDAGQTVVSFSCWVYCASANKASIGIYGTNLGLQESSQVGAGAWQLLTVENQTLNAADAAIEVRLIVDDSHAYFTMPMLNVGPKALPWRPRGIRPVVIGGDVRQYDNAGVGDIAWSDVDCTANTDNLAVSVDVLTWALEADGTVGSEHAVGPSNLVAGSDYYKVYTRIQVLNNAIATAGSGVMCSDSQIIRRYVNEQDADSDVRVILWLTGYWMWE